MLALLARLDIQPDELLADSADGAWIQRLSAYWAARRRFIEAGRDVQPTPDALAMLRQVRAPLLRVLHISPDFRPAYDPLLRIATELGRTDPNAARELLMELERVQPLRPEASQLLRTPAPATAASSF